MKGYRLILAAMKPRKVRVFRDPMGGWYAEWYDDKDRWCAVGPFRLLRDAVGFVNNDKALKTNPDVITGHSCGD